MAASIDIQIKQDSISLKETAVAPPTGAGESVLFLDATDKQLKVRNEQNGLIRNLIIPVEIPTLETLGAAATGENTDITSLGTVGSLLSIKGEISLPHISNFFYYQSAEQFIYLPTSVPFTKVQLDFVNKDNLGECINGSFSPKRPGFYLLNGVIALRKLHSEAPFRFICSILKNEEEFVRGDDFSNFPDDCGGRVTGLTQLDVGDNISLGVFSSCSVRTWGGSAYTNLTGVRLA